MCAILTLTCVSDLVKKYIEYSSLPLFIYIPISTFVEVKLNIYIYIKCQLPCCEYMVLGVISKNIYSVVITFQKM